MLGSEKISGIGDHLGEIFNRSGGNPASVVAGFFAFYYIRTVGRLVDDKAKIN